MALPSKPNWTSAMFKKNKQNLNFLVSPTNANIKRGFQISLSSLTTFLDPHSVRASIEILSISIDKHSNPGQTKALPSLHELMNLDWRVQHIHSMKLSVKNQQESWRWAQILEKWETCHVLSKYFQCKIHHVKMNENLNAARWTRSRWIQKRKHVH